MVFIPRIPNQPSDKENSFKFTRKQFPVRLCFAMTINKSQGQSVKHVELDLLSSVFTHGQFYSMLLFLELSLSLTLRLSGMRRKKRP